MRVAIAQAALLALAALMGRPAAARADADEASIEPQVTAGVVSLHDPEGAAAKRSGFAGAGARVTWGGSRNWLAWQADGVLGATTSALARTTPGADPRRFQRGAIVGAVDAGATLRFGEPFGYAMAPTVTVAAGAVFRHYGEAAQFRVSGGQAAGIAAVTTEVDPVVRVGAGFEARLGRHWLAAVRVDARQTAGLGSGPARALTITLAASYLWYPRWRTF